MQFKHYPQFFTATILEWKHLLQNDNYKQVIINSLKYLVDDNRVTVYAFVIMPNHIHLIWQIHDSHAQHKVQQSFMKFTAQQIKFDLMANNTKLLEEFKVNAADREYQIWERNPLSIDLFTEPVFKQKLNYIHENPVQEKWKLVLYPEDYMWSSAKFYYSSKSDYSFLRHYADGSGEQAR